jgi:hypothetical protein
VANQQFQCWGKLQRQQCIAFALPSVTKRMGHLDACRLATLVRHWYHACELAHPSVISPVVETGS